MLTVIYRFLPVLLLSLALLLGGCSDFDEMKGAKLLGQAETLLEKGDEAAAEILLADLVAQYPASRAGVTAAGKLQQMQAVRLEQGKAKIFQILDSYRQVLSGYRFMYSEYPRSLAALDESGYFFDSSYLDDITPEGFRVYLFLQNDGSGYHLWCVRDELEQGYSVDASRSTMVPFDRVEGIEALKNGFNSDSWDLRVVKLDKR